MGITGRLPRYREKAFVAGCRTGTGLLCNKCEDMISRSRLLTGSRMPITSTAERHSHYSLRDLRISAPKCTLCNLLLDLQDEETPPQQTKPSTSSNLNPGADSGDECLVVEIKKENSPSYHDRFRMQVFNGKIICPRALSVTEGKTPANPSIRKSEFLTLPCRIRKHTRMRLIKHN